MTTWNVDPDLRKMLTAAVNAEVWDEDEKERCRRVVAATPDGAYTADQDRDPEEDDYRDDSLSSLVTYFGVEHLAT